MTNHLRDIEQDFFDAYFSNLSDDDKEGITTISASSPGNDATSSELLALYLCGKKTAGSGLVADYINTGDPLPKPGHLWIVLDKDKKPKCILKTVAVEVHKFKDVPERIAKAEGEGDLSLDYWRRAHQEFFKPHLKRLKIENLDEAEVVTEFFERVHKAED
ncbi:MAG: ASCH domain-containing protein [Bdellovibrionaceae bacterium]|nr:ASCH domain-containing protein [Pseudobdellovibrionaceae bacterium]